MDSLIVDPGAPTVSTRCLLSPWSSPTLATTQAPRPLTAASPRGLQNEHVCPTASSARTQESSLTHNLTVAEQGRDNETIPHLTLTQRRIWRVAFIKICAHHRAGGNHVTNMSTHLTDPARTKRRPSMRHPLCKSEPNGLAHPLFKTQPSLPKASLAETPMIDDCQVDTYDARAAPDKRLLNVGCK